jgi:hypothetical protein
LRRHTFCSRLVPLLWRCAGFSGATLVRPPRKSCAKPRPMR